MPSGIGIGMGGGGRLGRETRYCPVKTSDPSSVGGTEDTLRYKTIDSAGLPRKQKSRVKKTELMMLGV